MRGINMPEQKIRVRFGLRIKLPFGVFPSAGVFVGYMAPDSFAKIKGIYVDLSAALTLAEKPEWASMLIFEAS